ncbi:TPA: aminopeptidase P family protein [Corynebacterium striatum]|uniref:M24 family metallopeptidase n=1 Tax=Corynebacterium striatum TaxID=43770 RepID=UPI00194EE7DA|nr:Xaa-Pro peptidase family protein [Corynebacterium striatum]QRP18155.1 aminopeptidase P family protein [Corynebacterium striatum]HAT1136549.1 aminopeptidase P family protein [Corynebacterium striatum]HAT1195467.1 aminopeptidase P family protein [Corynebacterium striatum]HAT1214271.1 aminopeptidase P family protein [Corynebacterium striatum]HAT1247766.1 aminopeptidase P family protein [Corynebacterium striatum]
MSDSNSTFPVSVYADRLQRAQEVSAEKGIDLLILGTGADFAYLTGSWVSSHERLTALVLGPTGKPFIVAPSTDIETLNSSPVAQLGLELRGWSDGENPYELACEPLRATTSSSTPTVALGASLTADHVLRIQGLLAESAQSGAQPQYVLATYSLAELFTRKDAAELEELTKAGAAIDAVHAAVPGLLRAGRTEADVAADLRDLILRQHVEVDFIIVGSGPNGANPHYDYGDRVLSKGDPVVVDIGGTLPSGYHSDTTRTYVVGGDLSAAPQDFQDAYAVLERAQAAGRAAAKPGATAQEVDRATREVIEEAGYGEYFTHRTGHGIGLSTHEEPFIMAGNELVLEEGMAFSIEPGIYVPGKWGMRLEDIVYTTADGYESVNQAPREVR